MHASLLSGPGSSRPGRRPAAPRRAKGAALTSLGRKGIVVTSSEKSQHQNRAKAMKVLKARLYDLQRTTLDNARAEARKTQVGSGDRSERIRTYNFPQGRVTDHRINLTLYSLPQVMEGEIDELLDALIAEDQAARLATLEDELA